MKILRATLTLLIVCASSDFCVYAAPGNAPHFEVSLEPSLNPGTQSIDAIDVTLRASELKTPGGNPSLEMPLISFNVETIAKTLEGLSASDAKGTLKLTVHDDPEGGREFNRHWMADRNIAGALLIHYRAPITNRLSPLGGAPPLELRSDGAAFSGSGAAFLVLPETKDPYQLAVRWNLTKLPAGSSGLSSFGGGDRQAEDPASLDHLRRMFFMGGLIGSYPQPSPVTGYFSAWQGTPPFDVKGLMRWTRDLHGHFAMFFKETTSAPYGVFLRPNLVNPGGGVGQEHSFVGTFDANTKEMDLKFTLSHEMLHTYIGGLGGHEDSDLESSWFSEGLAVYYQRTLPLRYGQISPSEFLSDLNKTAGRYYTDALANTPNSEIPAQFWSNTLVRVLPYDRGALYFATVNDAVRKASHGERSLDDLLLNLLQRRQKTGVINESDWEDALSHELGQQALGDFRSMLAGKEILPASEAFGDCFRRTTKPLRRYELGFDPKVMAERHRVVRGLLPDSAAARAGLKEGDEILKPFGQDTVQEDQTRTITVEIRRDGKTQTITYLPRGATVQAYQWERLANTPDAACAN